MNRESENKNSISHYKQAFSNPKAFYKQPADVVQDSQLSKEEKLNILKQWEYDLRDIMVAEEENMAAKEDKYESTTFDLVVAAIRKLDPSYQSIYSSGTKQGGRE